MTIYNQKLQKDTLYSCTIYTMLHIIKYDFWVSVNIDNILWIVKYMEKIWALLPRWAYFAVIYPAMVKLLEWKTWLKFKIEVSYITAGLDKKRMWGLGFLKANRFYHQKASDKLITVQDLIDIKDWPKGSWHNHAWKKNTIIESLGAYHYNIDIKTLKHGVKLGLYYDKARTIVAGNEKTKKIQKNLIKIAKKRGKTMSYKRFKYYMGTYG